jgi:hypothetical protein
MPDGRVGGSGGGSNGPLGKKPALPSRAPLPSRSSSAVVARKRTSHPATKSAASKRSKQTAAAASSSVPSGTQLSLFGFASPSPRFASPRAASPSLAHTWHNDDDDDDEDAVMCTGSNIFRADPAASAGQPALSEPKGSAPPVAPPHSLASRSSAAHASASLSAESEAAQAESAVTEWPSWKLVEVKGPTDRCSMQQIAWLAQLAQCAACHVEVCYVLLPSQVDKWKGASAPTSRTASSTAAARCSSVEFVDLEESD